MKRPFLTLRGTLLAALLTTCLTGSRAAERFVVFQSEADAWKLNDITIGYSEAEHSCVRLAATNLAADFE